MLKKNIRYFVNNFHYIFLFIGIGFIILKLIEDNLFTYEKIQIDNIFSYLLGIFIIFLFFLINIVHKSLKQSFNISLLICIFIIFIFEAILLIKFTYVDKLTHETVGDYLFKNNNIQDTYPSISPIMYAKKYLLNEGLSLGGVPNAKTIVCNENGYFLEFISDQYGLNNDKKKWEQNNDYIIVGDSFAFGSCVKPQFSMSSIFENYFNKKNVNIAYRSNGPLIELISLKYFVDRVSAKKILWFFYEGNDFNDLIEELSIQKLKNLYINYDETKIYSNEVNTNLINLYADSFKNYILNREKKNYFDTIKKFFSIRMIRNYLNYNINHSNFSNKSYNNDFLLNSNAQVELNKIFKEVKAISNSNKIDLYFVYIPAIENLLDKKNKIYLEEKKILFSILNNLNINIIDTSEILYLEENPKILLSKYQIPGHFNPYGFRLLVSFIEERIPSQ